MGKATFELTDEERQQLESRFGLIWPDELAQPAEPLDWLIRGLWLAGSYGPFGGAKKTLKTYIALTAAVAVAAGRPAFNNPDWEVPEPRPVLYYGGEGGLEMYKRRLQRVAADVYGIADLSELPIVLVTDVGPFDGLAFRETLTRNIAQVTERWGQPGLVVLDSLYNYHPADVEVSNLYERGRLLGQLSNALRGHGVALWVVDHFNKNGNGIDLDRLAQAGMSAWADSWLLFEHGEVTDVPNGSFDISTAIGSRHWGGAEWTLHYNIGVFDLDTNSYLSSMKVEVREGLSSSGRKTTGTGAGDPEIDAQIVAFINANPDSTKSEIVTGVKAECGAGSARVSGRFAALLGDRRIVPERRARREGGREVQRELWSVAAVKVSLKAARDASANAGGATRPGTGRGARTGRAASNPTGNPTRRPRAKGGKS